MLALIVSTILVIHHEGHLIPLFKSSRPDDYDEDDILRALLKFSAQEKLENKAE